MKLQARVKEEPTVDLTSLIDVVFLLLIFFMVSTTFEHQAVLKVDLPEGTGVDASADEPDPDRLELVIDANGLMFLNDQQLIESTPKHLMQAFTNQAGENREIQLTLRADRETPHHYVVTAMDVAGQMGFTNLSIAIDRSAGNGE